jgi:hypothetical protein
MARQTIPSKAGMVKKEWKRRNKGD